MSINLYDVELTARARHQQLLEDAERQRLIKQAMAGRPKKRAAVAAKAITVMAIGARLRQWLRRPAPQEQVPCVQVSC